MSSRTFNRSASFALAEGGIDYAIHALNTESSSGWTVSGDTWKRTLSDYVINAGSTGTVQIEIKDASSSTPTVYSVGSVSNASGPSVSRQVKVVLGDSSSGGTLNTSLFYAKAVDAAGNNVFAVMYNSNNGDEGVIYYDDETSSWVTNYDDGLRLVIDTITDSSGNLGNMDVFGWVVTGPGGAIDFNSNGGTFTFNSFYDLDNGVATTDRVTDDFYGSFDPQTAPTGLANVSNSSPTFVTTGRGSSRVTAATWDGSKNYVYSGGGDVLTVSNGDALNITGDVVLVVDGGGAIEIQGDLNILPGASLKVYTDGDFTVSGSVNNSNVAENLQIYGTNTTENEQLFKLHGNGRMTSFLYAPNAAADLKGGGNQGQFEGALVMNQIKMTGNYFFLGDAALGIIDGLINVGGGYIVKEWVELDDRRVETAKYSMN